MNFYTMPRAPYVRRTDEDVQHYLDSFPKMTMPLTVEERVRLAEAVKTDWGKINTQERRGGNPFAGY